MQGRKQQIIKIHNSIAGPPEANGPEGRAACRSYGGPPASTYDEQQCAYGNGGQVTFVRAPAQQNCNQFPQHMQARFSTNRMPVQAPCGGPPQQTPPPRYMEGRQGPQGKCGEPGQQGRSGPPGEKGRPGDQGPMGQVGPRGYTGEQGQQGPAGAQGPRGIPGAMGPQGPAGPAGETRIVPCPKCGTTDTGSYAPQTNQLGVNNNGNNYCGPNDQLQGGPRGAQQVQYQQGPNGNVYASANPGGQGQYYMQSGGPMAGAYPQQQLMGAGYPQQQLMGAYPQQQQQLLASAVPQAAYGVPQASYGIPQASYGVPQAVYGATAVPTACAAPYAAAAPVIAAPAPVLAAPAPVLAATPVATATVVPQPVTTVTTTAFEIPAQRPPCISDGTLSTGLNSFGYFYFPRMASATGTTFNVGDAVPWTASRALRQIGLSPTNATDIVIMPTAHCGSEGIFEISFQVVPDRPSEWGISMNTLAPRPDHVRGSGGYTTLGAQATLESYIPVVGNFLTPLRKLDIIRLQLVASLDLNSVTLNSNIGGTAQCVSASIVIKQIAYGQ